MPSLTVRYQRSRPTGGETWSTGHQGHHSHRFPALFQSQVASTYQTGSKIWLHRDKCWISTHLTRTSVQRNNLQISCHSFFRHPLFYRLIWHIEYSISIIKIVKLNNFFLKLLWITASAKCLKPKWVYKNLKKKMVWIIEILCWVERKGLEKLGFFMKKGKAWAGHHLHWKLSLVTL